MLTSILVTDGGPHSAAKWAEATSSHIVSIADGISGEKQVSALKLQAAVIDILTKGHHDVQHGERQRIAHDASVINGELNANVHTPIAVMVNEIIGAGVGTAWEADMATPAFAESLNVVLSSHLHTSMHIERSWHAERNPDTEHAQTFRAANPTPSVGV